MVLMKRKMQNKWLYLSVLVVIVLLVIAGCSKGTPSASPAPSSTDVSTPAPAGTTTPGAASDDPAALASWSEMTLHAGCLMQTSAYQPTNDVLTPIWRAKTKVKLDCSDFSTPASQGGPTMQQMLAANNLPDVILTAGAGLGTDSYKLLKGAGKIHEITKDMINKYMPRYVKYLNDLGVTVDQVYDANKDPADGKLWELPGGGAAGAYTKAVNTHLMDFGWVWQYNAFYRDDILKKIFPGAKTEAELRALYVKNGGKLSYEEMTSDVPINSLNDMLEYLRRVKALNMKQGDKPISAVLQSSTQNVNSLLWSMFTLPGWIWTETGERTQKGEVLTYTPLTPEYKDYFQFWNTAYNEGDIDPESFIMKDDQLNAKIINGELAVFNGWGPVSQARDTSKKENRGYGFRELPWGTDMKLSSKYQDFTYKPASLLAGLGDGKLILTTVKDSDMPQVLNWFDWQTSEEAADLRAWGLPEWSTGTGDNRRFKPEYKALEAWALYGTKGDKDGNSYGLRLPNDGDPNNGVPYVDFETQLITLTPGDLHSPIYTYPPAVNTDVNLENTLLVDESLHFRDLGEKYYPTTGWSFSELDPKGDFDKIDSATGIYSAKAKTRVAALVTGKPADFEKNYKTYMTLFDDAEWQKQWAAMQDRWKTMWNTHIQPSIDKLKK